MKMFYEKDTDANLIKDKKENKITGKGRTLV